ncbi:MULTISPECIES: pilin [unclassified Acinetobacter]|uniref:type IV pilin protein n=1 Tax=unclassified Acinetobacter TaxID=196816 RepID=UPI0029353250|nr:MULTISPECIES: pilin [unclassified Acinetobacter]WOE31093.1 pilin [Acinetobacter sp. SAAs470]WOE39289.1 pilin [Acinetobacter sp. SAAs474]
MLVVVLITILAVIAIPLFQQYARQAIVSQAQQEMLHLAILLERHKVRNFSYRGFSPTSIAIPRHVSAQKHQYQLMIVDGDQVNLKLTDEHALGQHWAIQAQPIDHHHYPALLMTSQGIRCKNNNTLDVNFKHCGDHGQEVW